MIKMLKIGFLNLLRNKRRSVFNIIAIGVCTAVFLLFMGIWHGEKKIMYESAVKFLAGHIQIHANGYDELSNLMPEDKTIPNSSEVVETCKNTPHVTEVLKRAEFQAMIGNGRQAAGAVVIGVEPEKEKDEVFVKSVIKGEFVTSGHQVVIGKPIADIFDFNIGDELIVTGENKYKQPNLDSFKIVGIFNTGSHYYDENNVFTSMSTAQKFLAYDSDEVNVIHVKVEKHAYVNRVRDKLAETTGNAYEIFPWQHFAPEIVDGLKADQAWYTVTMAIMLFLMGFGLLNTMSMSIFERYRELGTMRAVGFRKMEILLMLVAESVFTGCIALVLGLILSVPGNVYMATKGIEYPQEVMKELTIPVTIETFRSIPKLIDMAWAALIALFIPALGTLYPAYKALRKSIVDELHHIT